MKTTAIANAKENGAVKNQSTDKSAIRPAVPLKDADKTEIKEEPKGEMVKPADLKPQEQPKVEVKTVVATNEEPKGEPTKNELREQLKEVKPAMNLDETIKLALDLNRRINQRGKLLETIGTLEEFEIAQKNDAEGTDGNNHYQGCELTIEDDKGREFTTKNPFIINAVAKMVNQLCVDKLAEIEGEIFIPNK